MHLQWPAQVLQVIAVQCSTVKFSAVQCSSVQYSAMEINSVQFNSAKFISVQCSAVQCDTVQCSAVQWPSGSNCDCHRCSCLQQMSSLATSDDSQLPHVQAATVSPQCPPPSDSSLLLDGSPLASGAPGSGAGSSLETIGGYLLCWEDWTQQNLDWTKSIFNNTRAICVEKKEKI